MSGAVVLFFLNRYVNLGMLIYQMANNFMSLSSEVNLLYCYSAVLQALTASCTEVRLFSNELKEIFTHSRRSCSASAVAIETLTVSQYFIWAGEWFRD